MTAVTLICVQADLELILSEHGVAMFADHDKTGSPDTGVVDAVIARATDTLGGRLKKAYIPNDLVNSRLAKRWCAVLACVYLTHGRGNGTPASLAGEYQEIMQPGGLIDLVLKNQMDLPDIERRPGGYPTFTNLTMVRAYPRSKVRRVPLSSSDAPSDLPRDDEPGIIFEP